MERRFTFGLEVARCYDPCRDEQLGAAAGPTVMDPAGRTMYFLVPPGTTRTWAVPRTTALGVATHVVLPPDHKQAPPGPQWLLTPNRTFTSTSALQRALVTFQGPRTRARPDELCDLARLTFGQAQVRNCALCGAQLLTDRSLGVFTHDRGLLTEPTELRACAPVCRTPGTDELPAPTDKSGEMEKAPHRVSGFGASSVGRGQARRRSAGPTGVFARLFRSRRLRRRSSSVVGHGGWVPALHGDCGRGEVQTGTQVEVHLTAGGRGAGRDESGASGELVSKSGWWGGCLRVSILSSA